MIAQQQQRSTNTNHPECMQILSIQAKTANASAGVLWQISEWDWANVIKWNRDISNADDWLFRGAVRVFVLYTTYMQYKNVAYASIFIDGIRANMNSVHSIYQGEQERNEKCCYSVVTHWAEEKASLPQKDSKFII